MRNPELAHIPKWMSVADASIELGAKESTLWQAMHRYKNKGFYPDWIKVPLINTAYLRAVYKERVRLWNIMHDYYYYMQEITSDAEMSRSLAKFTGKSKSAWNTYLAVEMFHRVDNTYITNTNISGRMVDFISWAEFIIPKVERFKIEHAKSIKKYDLEAGARALDTIPGMQTAYA